MSKCIVRRADGGRSGDRGFAHPLRLSGLRRRGRARPRTGASSREEEPCVPLTLRRVFDYAADGADRRTGVHRRGAPAQYGCGRIGIGWRIRSFAGADAARPEGAARHGRQPLFPDAGLYFRRVRRPHGGCDGAGDEQLRQRQSGDRGHGAGSRLRTADGRFGGADAPCAGAEPPDGDLYQTEFGAALGAVRLRRGGYGVELAASPT